MSTRAVRRAERRKERRKQQEREPKRSFPWFTALVVGVVIVLGLVGLKAAGAFDAAPATPSASPVSTSAIKANQGTAVPVMEATHIDPSQSFTAYNSTPPSSGPHWSATGRAPINWGVYTTQQRNEAVVHNLEHGGVLIAYEPSLSQDQVDQLRALRSRWPKDKFQEVKIIVEPYAGLTDAKIALTAWGFIDKMDAFDEQRILGFIAAHIDKGPEDVP